MRKIDDINAWKIFQSLAQSRSLSSTADEYDQDVSTISRTIAGLEKVLGQDLIYRNVRPIQLTEVGQRAYELVTPLLQIHREMISEIQAGVAPLQGKFRGSQAKGCVERVMIPLLLECNSV